MLLEQINSAVLLNEKEIRASAERNNDTTMNSAERKERTTLVGMTPSTTDGG
jgi:hypothetical protein